MQALRPGLCGNCRLDLGDGEGQAVQSRFPRRRWRVPQLCLRTTEYLAGTKDEIFRCRTIKSRAEQICYDASCFDFLKVSYDEYIMKGAKTQLHVTAPVGIEQAAIPTRGRDFIPRRLCIRPTDYARFGYTQGCRSCVWQQHEIGPRPGHTEACRTRLETEIFRWTMMTAFREFRIDTIILLPKKLPKVMKRESTIRGSRDQMSPNHSATKEQAMMHLQARHPGPTRTPSSSTSE